MMRFLIGTLALTASITAGVGCDAPAGAAADVQDLTSDVAATLGPNDVSILWPIADKQWAGEYGEPLAKGYLKLFPTAGEKGPAFPSAAVYDANFPLLAAERTQDEVRKALAVVSMRATPCAASHVPGECVPQLRLVAQPLLAGSPSIHIIYRLTEQNLDALVTELAAWRDRSPVPTGNRLTVHPGLQKAGVDSPFARELTDIVARYATDAALTRITFSTFRRQEPIGWTFSQFDREGSGWKQTTIPGLAEGTRSQMIHWPTFEPEPRAARDFSTITVAATDVAPTTTNTPQFLAARDAVLVYENPKASNAETIDCGGCHAASSARVSGMSFGMSFETAATYVAPSWIDTSLKEEELSNDMVAFGYGQPAEGFIGVRPSISPRVVNETAETLAQLRERHR